MKPTVVVEVCYPHPPERVWRALTDRAALADWLLPNDFEPRRGHRFQFWAPPRDGGRRIAECEVVEVDEPRRLSYTWQSEPDQPPTLVTWTLDPTEGGTRVRLEHQADELPCVIALGALSGSGWEWALSFELPRLLRRLNGVGERRARKRLVSIWVYPRWVSDRGADGGRPGEPPRVVALPRRGGWEEELVAAAERRRR